MKKFGALALAVALTASLSVPALAAEGDQPLLIVPAPISSEQPEETGAVYAPAVPFAAELVLNGETLDASAIPDAAGIPLRLLAEHDHGFADWYADESRGYASLDANRIYVSVPSGEITLNGEVLTDVTATIREGVTFLPVEFFDRLEGYSVKADAEAGRYEITTPNGAPLIKLAFSIKETSGMAMGMKGNIADFEENYSLPAGTFAEGVTFTGVSTTPDCMVLARLSPEADAQAVKTALETQRQSLMDTFSWYLSHNLPKVKASTIEFDGDYVLFLVAEGADKGIELFHAFVAGQAGM